MPLKLNKAYTRAKSRLGPGAMERLHSIIEADPRMAQYLNEYGMENAALSEYPIAVIPPENYLQMARKNELRINDAQNRQSLLSRIKSGGPNASRMDFYDKDTTPPFLREYVHNNPDATAHDIYSEKGVGLPPGYDMHPRVDAYADPDDYDVDMGGIPVLKYSPRTKRIINITDHEGRGRNAFAFDKDFHMPVQMMQRTAIPKDDHYLPVPRDWDEGVNLLTRMKKRGSDIGDALSGYYNHDEAIPLGDEMTRKEAQDFLRQITGAIPEDYIRHGFNRQNIRDEGAQAVPWKFPVFAEGGSVQHFDHGGPYEREYDDNLPVLRRIAEAIDSGALSNPVSPMSQLLGPYLKEFIAGGAGQNLGVNRDTGKVGIGQGGISGIGAINDTKAMGAGFSDYDFDDPRNPGYQSMRMQNALHDQMNLSDDPDLLERLSNMGGAIAGQFPAWLFSDGASTPAVVGSTLAQISKFAKPAMELAERAPSALRKAGRMLNYGAEAFTPVNNVGIKPQQLIPAAGIGEGISQGINSTMEAAAPSLAKLQMEIQETYGDPEAFATALHNGDPHALSIQERYGKIMDIQDDHRKHMSFPRGRWSED